MKVRVKPNIWLNEDGMIYPPHSVIDVSPQRAKQLAQSVVPVESIKVEVATADIPEVPHSKVMTTRRQRKVK